MTRLEIQGLYSVKTGKAIPSLGTEIKYRTQRQKDHDMGMRRSCTKLYAGTKQKGKQI